MTSTETGSSWSERLSPRNWSLPWKLVAVGLVPAVLAVVLGVLRVADQAHTASELGSANRLLAAREQVADVATALRVERDRATTYVAERRQGDRGAVQQAVRDTDAALDRLRSGVPAADLDQATRTAFEQAQGGFAQVPVLRGEVDGTGPLLPADIMQSYSGVVARTDVLDRALLRDVSIPDVGGLADALTASTAASEALALQHTVLGAALKAGSLSPADRAVVNATDNALTAAYTEYQVALPATQTPVNFITSRANAQRDADKATILSAPDPGPISLTSEQWNTDSQAAAERVSAATGGAARALSDAGNAAEARSSNLAGLNSVLLMLGVLVAATIVVLMSRSLTRSLRVLRTSALEIAGRRLPHAVEAIRSGATSDVAIEPVPLHTRDEIGEVARAFDEVHDQALRLAADQAALQSSVSNMFVNLSRRSQGLVERQLQLIEQLESNEQDPDQLSNLFQLDHLATRMRRNSENLLVLAGTDFAKRNVAPVPLVDVLRAAVSEIEHYQRVVVQAPPQATIVGRSTSDIVHLLAELLDNATSFSPPDSQVIISSHRTSDSSILVEIADRGVGIPEQELVDANRRLSTPSAVDVSASRRMGLYVVGRLGTRHGITVHLGGAQLGASLGAPGGGLTASVTLPAHLVVSTGEAGGRPPRPDGTLAPAQGNGVPPQRAGYLGRPNSRTPFAAPANGQALAHSGGVNGLPTRTPGSSLRRDSGPLAAAAAPPAERPTATAVPAEQAAPLALPVQPAARVDTDGVDTDGRGDGGRGDDRRDTDRRAAETPDTGPRAVVPGTDSPTGVVPAVGAAALERAGDAGADDADDTPPSGRPGDARVVRGGWSVPTRAPGSKPTPGGGATTRAGDDVPERSTPNGSTRQDEGRRAAAAGAAASTTGAAAPDTGRPRRPAPRPVPAERGRTDDGSTPLSTTAPASGTPSDGTEAASRGAARTEAAPAEAAEAAPRDAAAAPAQNAGQDAGQDPTQDSAEDRAQETAGAVDDAAPVGRPGPPRPRPTPGPGPNGTYRDLPVPAAAYEAFDERAQNGTTNGLGQNGATPYGPDREDGPSPRHPYTTPLPVVPDSEASTGPRPFAAPGVEYDGADALFAASVPAIAEPDGLPRSRRPLGELRRGPDEVIETTPIFEEIASAWFASQRPVPVDWELGQRPGAETEEAAETASPAPERPDRVLPSDWADPSPAASPVPAPAASASPSTSAPSGPSVAPPAQAFATAADEGWRAASGAAAERPDELTAAGLPKRRPRARLVPGSAGSAVLAAPASPSRSAESVRGRLASYQQGVRQGREIRLRRDPGSAGAEPGSNGEDAAASAGGEHDEENR